MFQKSQDMLVPQNPEDEPASILLEQIRNERDKLVKDRKIKKPKSESTIFRGSDKIPDTQPGHFYEKIGNGNPIDITKELPFEIPDSWEWVRLGSALTFINGVRGKNYPSKDKLHLTGTYPFISTINFYKYYKFL